MEPTIIKFANMGFDQIDKENTAKKKSFQKKKKNHLKMKVGCGKPCRRGKQRGQR